MALSLEYKQKSLKQLTERCEKLRKLNKKKQQLLTAINDFSAANDMPLGHQSDAVINFISEQLETPFEESTLQQVAVSIYSRITDIFDRERVENQRKHRNQGSYDRIFVHRRSLHDQLQDHDMTLLMPQSYGNIEVLGIVNRFDSSSIDAVQEGLVTALKDKKIKHIFIPIGPGHWRGFYLTKPNDGENYQLELFDPFGPSGADALRDISLDLLKRCGIKENQITITTSGPIHPQRDGYACGDFTCAYSHRKMKALGAPGAVYNQDLITVLDSQGNKGDVLRHESRRISKLLEASPLAPLAARAEVERDDLPFAEADKREFLLQLGKQLANPVKIDKVVLDKEIAKIKSAFGTHQFASLRELDTYGVFKADGSLNKAIAAQYEIQFEESKIKTRLESYGLSHLSFREMIIFESVISSVIQDLTYENNNKAMMLEAELHTLENGGPSVRSRKEALKTELAYLQSHPPARGLAKACFAEFGTASKEFKLTNPLGMELATPAKQLLGMGYFKFKDINVSISPGPSAARSLTPSEHPELYEAQRDIARYLNNLLANNVTHVFAMGSVRPYASMQEGLDNDFINYFIPDASGRVKLPNIPELKDIHITSHPIAKVGRFITYEISINGNKPIQVHHFPIQDQQPLKLTAEELAYVQKIGMTAALGQNIHTHCRDGKGCSKQIAYLLASLNPQYQQANHAELIAQMSTESAEVASLDAENLELYVIYSTLLKQEIDKCLQQIGTSKKLVKEEHPALFDLLKKHQELSSTPSGQLDAWVRAVCQNPIIARSSTRTAFTSIKNATEFLLHIFKEQRDLNELELFFDLQSQRGGYQGICRELALIATAAEQTREEREQLTKYGSLFVARLQDAYLRNCPKEDRLLVCIDVKNNVARKLTDILTAITQHDPKKFTKSSFENLRKEYERCKQRIELLEKVEIDDYEALDAELIQRSKVIEQLLILGYEQFEVEPAAIITKMHLIYQQLGQLSATNELSPQQWNVLKKQFIALQTIFNFTKTDDIAVPGVLLTLDKLFQGNREHTTHPFKLAISQASAKKQHLNDFVASLGFAVLDAVINELPREYYGEDAKGFYAQEINQLLEAITHLAATYERPIPEKIDLSRIPEFPTAEEYEKARQEVVQLVAKHAPFLITMTNALRAQLENLEKDFLRLEKHAQLGTSEFKELKKRFAALKSEYLNSDEQNVLMTQRMEQIETRINKVVDPNAKDRLLLESAAQKYSKSLENLLRIKAIKAGASQTTLDEIDYFESRIEKNIPRKVAPPKPPKLIIFDIDDVLTDLSINEQKRVRELIHVLQYANAHHIEVVLTTNHSPSLLAEEQALITKLKTIIAQEAKIDISNMLTFLNAVPLRQEKETVVKYFQNKIAALQQEIERLKSQIPEDLTQKAEQEKKERLEATIRKLQSEIVSLKEKSVALRLTSNKLLNLDVIRHSHGFKDLDSYYHAVEGGILKDFKNPELTKNIKIPDFIERAAIWAELFKLAKIIMQSKSLTNPKPSLQTILKDLIFDAHKPEVLQKKYTVLQESAEAIQRINVGREYFRRYVSQIDAFYQERLAVQKSEYELSAVLKEEDIVFFETDRDLVDQARQHSNYRPIKLNEHEQDSSRYMVDLNYEMGAYNGVIAYLNDDKTHSPKAYGPKAINKTLKAYLNTIPDFAKQEFRHTPIVLHVSMSTILAKLHELSSEEADQKRYMEQFFEAAIERFAQLPKALQDDFVTGYYRGTDQALKAMHQKLKELITSPPPLLQFQEELTKLQGQADKIIARDAKFSRGVSPTFLSSEAKLLNLMIQKIADGHIDQLKIEGAQVQFQVDHDKTRSQVYIESITEKPHVYLQAIHPTLQAIDLFNKGFIAEQYELFVMQQLEEVIKRRINENAWDSIAPSLESILAFVEERLVKMDPNKKDKLNVIRTYDALPVVKAICSDLAQIAPYQNRALNLKEKPDGDYLPQISALLEQVTRYTNTIEASEEYKAKLFLDKAKQYLLANDWQVGFQWNPHTVKVRGKERAIPETVAEQLAVIEKAQKNGKYLEAKSAFLQLGQDKEDAWTSSTKARKYYSLFKSEKSKSDAVLEKEFTKKNTI